jgi:hypothetical protein
LGDLQIEFDPDRLELTMSSNHPFPKVKAFDHVDSDMLGQEAGEIRAPGPLADPAAKRVWQTDPRLAM